MCTVPKLAVGVAISMRRTARCRLSLGDVPLNRVVRRPLSWFRRLPSRGVGRAGQRRFGRRRRVSEDERSSPDPLIPWGPCAALGGPQPATAPRSDQSCFPLRGRGACVKMEWSESVTPSFSWS